MTSPPPPYSSPLERSLTPSYLHRHYSHSKSPLSEEIKFDYDSPFSDDSFPYTNAVEPFQTEELPIVYPFNLKTKRAAPPVLPHRRKVSPLDVAGTYDDYFSFGSAGESALPPWLKTPKTPLPNLLPSSNMSDSLALPFYLSLPDVDPIEMMESVRSPAILTPMSSPEVSTVDALSVAHGLCKFSPIDQLLSKFDQENKLLTLGANVVDGDETKVEREDSSAKVCEPIDQTEEELKSQEELKSLEESFILVDDPFDTMDLFNKSDVALEYTKVYEVSSLHD